MQAGASTFQESWHEDVMGTPIEKPDHCFHYIHLKSKSIRIWVCNPISLSQSTPSKTATDCQEKRHHAPLVQRLSRLTLVVTLRISRVTQASRCWWPSFVWPPRPQRRYGCWLLVVGWVCDMVSFPRVSVSFKVFKTWDFLGGFKSAEACLCCVELLHVAAWDEESPRFHGLNLDPKPIARLHMEKSHRKKFPKTWIIFPSTSTFFGFPKLSLFH